MKRILVAGCSGFIGVNLTRYLLDLGNHVIGIDNFASSSIRNCKRIIPNDRFEFIQHDICQPLPDLKGIDEIYHMASPASPVDFEKIPIEIVLVNTLGTKHLLDLALANGAKILFASTSEVYGEPLEHPQREEYRGNVSCTGIRSCYDEGKRCGEALVYAYQRQKQANVRIVRIFNTYGPYMRLDDGRVVTNFIKNALLNKDLVVFGDGQQTRCMQYIDDLLAGLVALMASDHSTSPINLGSTDEITMLDLANTVLRITKSTSKVVFQPIRADDPTRRRPDITLAQKMLNFKHQFSLEQGVQRTIEYARKELANSVNN